MQKESSNEPLQVKRWRAITYDWDILSTYGNTSRAYCLTDFQVAWLLSNCDYFAWSSRWSNCPCTTEDMQTLKAELEYNLMDCIDIQPYQLQYIYDQTQANEIQYLNSLYDGTPSSVNPQTPDDYYSGGGSADRLNALCTACKIYIYSYAQNWVAKCQQALSIASVVSLATAILGVGGVIPALINIALGAFTQDNLDAFNDTDALDAVACCMNDTLTGLAITQANFITSLNSCSFAAGTNEQKIVDVMSDDMNEFGNWLSFINQVGNSYGLAVAGIYDCPCEPPAWSWDSDFENDEGIWHVQSSPYGNRGTWTDSVGYEYVDIQVDTSRFMRVIQITTDTFTPTDITHIQFTYNMTKGSVWSHSETAPLFINATLDDDSVLATLLYWDDLVDGNGQVLSDTYSGVLIKKISVTVRSSLDDTANYSGLPTLIGVHVDGNGVNPFV